MQLTSINLNYKTVKSPQQTRKNFLGPQKKQVKEKNIINLNQLVYASSASSNPYDEEVNRKKQEILSRYEDTKQQALQQQQNEGQSTPGQQSKSDPIKWGADLKGVTACFATGTVISLLPVPQGLTVQAWRLFAIFVSTILGIILQPVPLGAVAVLGLGATMITKVLTFDQAFSAFTNEIPWLIATAYWIAQGFIDTGLGKRIAYNIVRLFGKTTLGMTYSLVVAEALVAPLMPSIAARAGGIFFPLSKALCNACGSTPEDGTEKKMGSYVMMTCFLGTTISSAMFITAMAANPLTVNLAAQTLGYTISWAMWAKAAFIPGVISLLATPLILYWGFPPEVKNTPQAPETATQELKKLGPLSTNEKITAFALLITVGLWITGPAIGINNVAAAIVGFGILLISGVITWKKSLSNNAAWDTLTWFAALIGMAAYLNKFGFISWFSDKVVAFVRQFGLGWKGSFTLISMLYFYSHYLFASGSAHIGAMYTAFLSVSIALGVPGLPAALLLGQVSNTMGCLTNYGIGSAPPYFGSRYVSQNNWYKWGFIMSVFYNFIWLVPGMAIWKLMGLY